MKDIRCYLKDNKLITDGAFGTYYAGLYDTRELPERVTLIIRTGLYVFIKNI